MSGAGMPTNGSQSRDVRPDVSLLKKGLEAHTRAAALHPVGHGLDCFGGFIA